MMPASGPPNGDGPNQPIDPGPSPSVANTGTSDSNTTIPEEELYRYYELRHGRTFHTFPRSLYFLPADGEESNRLRAQHEIFQRLLGADYDRLLTGMLVPGRRGGSVVLDLGCGPGTWVEEFSAKYPSAYFIGVDLVPMLQQLENAQFECYDMLDSGIRRRDETAIVIHARCLSFGYNDFDRLLHEAHRVLAPGGLLLSVEIDWRLEQQKNFPLYNMQATREFIIRVAACAKVANGEDAWVPTLIPRWLTNAGFQNLQEDVRDMPVGPWMGSASMRELGNLVQPMYIQFVEAMKPALLNLPGAAVEDVNDLVDGVREELESEANTGWSIPVHIVTASKA